MGTRKQREKQEDIWIAHTELASAPGHPFYQRLNELLEGQRFDEFVEGRCAKFYAQKYGRPSLTPGDLLSVAADRVFRGRRQRTRDCMAISGLVFITAVFRDRAGRDDAGSLDDIAHTAIAGSGHASRSGFSGCWGF